MTLKPPPKMNRIGPMAADEFQIRTYNGTTTASGFPIPDTANMLPSVPGNLQVMSTSRQVQYQAVSEGTLFDLFLPEFYAGSALVIAASTEFVASDGTVLQSLGAGMPQGSSGRQVVPCQLRDR